MYLIQYKYTSPESKISSTKMEYMWFLSWNAKDALQIFYDRHPYPGIDRFMFEEITNKIPIESAVALHNALKPDFHVACILKCDDKPIYDENTKKEDSENEK